MLLPEIDRKVISTKYLPNDWEGPVIEIIENEEIPYGVRLDIVIGNHLISDKLLRLFAVWCARNVLKYVDAGVIGVLLDCAEKYAYKKIERGELVSMYLLTIKTLAINKKSEKLSEAEEAAYSVVHSQAKIAAKDAALHSENALSNYTDVIQIQRKHVWKIKDLILGHLTTGDVDFIIKNQHKKHNKDAA